MPLLRQNLHPAISLVPRVVRQSTLSKFYGLLAMTVVSVSPPPLPPPPPTPDQIVSLCEDMTQIWSLDTYGKQSIQCAAHSVICQTALEVGVKFGRNVKWPEI
jgi:hypothetical protein